MATIGILVGGGPAPGINGVIGAATISALRAGARVIGLYDGFEWLMQGETRHIRELKIADVSRIHLLGGSSLRTSRANPTKDRSKLASVVQCLDKLGIDHLITIGGDDTATSANAVASAAEGRIRVVHVPKTIDNDLPLPGDIPTFGFETAREHATQIVTRLMEDARTTQRWYFVVVMGRKAGHLALGTAKAAGATIALIPEDFPQGRIPLSLAALVLEASIVKRIANGRPHGVAVIAEGIGERLDPADLEGLDAVERDAHGHIRLAEVPLGKVLRDRVRDALAERGIQLTIGEKNVGYELRCVAPSAFDIDYTRDLGAGAVRMLLAGKTGVLVTRQGSSIIPIDFAQLQDPASGRTRVRLVDTGTTSHAIGRSLQVRLEAEDLSDPEQLARLAKAAKLSPEEARARYAPALEA